MKLGCRFQHKTSSLDLSVLQRNLCLLSLLGRASLVGAAQPVPKLNSRDKFEIAIPSCQICSAVVVAPTVKYLLNTLSYFHLFLRIDSSLRLGSASGRDMCHSMGNYGSTWYSQGCDCQNHLLTKLKFPFRGERQHNLNRGSGGEV